MVKHVVLVEALDVREIILTLTVFLLSNFGNMATLEPEYFSANSCCPLLLLSPPPMEKKFIFQLRER